MAGSNAVLRREKYMARMPKYFGIVYKLCWKSLIVKIFTKCKYEIMANNLRQNWVTFFDYHDLKHLDNFVM